MSEHRHESFWAQTAPHQRFPRLEGDLAADVAIVGGGLTGITAALLLQRAGRKVVVIEGREVGGGVTRNTTAHLTEALDTRLHTLVRDFGKDGAKLAAASQRAAIERIAAFVEEHSIDCGFRYVPGFLYAEDARGAEEVEREYDAAKKLGLPLTLTADVPLPWRVKQGLRWENQAQFHPLRYLLPLARAIEAGGGRIYENTRVLDVQDGEPCRVETDAGVVLARDVLVCTHAPANNRGILQTKLAQYRSYVIAVRLPQRAPVGLFWDTADPYHYLRSSDGTGDELFIVGGEDHKVGGDVDTRERYAALEAYCREKFPGCSVEHRWSAQVVEPADGLPYVGRMMASQHVYVATGFAGNGMTHGTMSAMLLSDLALGVKNPWEELYDPTRVKAFASAAEWLKENVDYPLHMVGDRLTPAEAKTLEEVPRGEGRIVSLGGEKLACYRDETGGVTTLSPVCTHMGCHVNWNAADKSWDCPCHGGRFDPKGEVLEGPPVAALKRKEPKKP